MARGILRSLAAVADLVRDSLACVGAASHCSDLGLERLRRKHQGPEWVDWPIRQLGALSSLLTACGGDPEGSRHLLPA